MSASNERMRKPLLIGPDQVHKYEMGRMRAIFFADAQETDNRYSIRVVA